MAEIGAPEQGDVSELDLQPTGPKDKTDSLDDAGKPTKELSKAEKRLALLEKLAPGEALHMAIRNLNFRYAQIPVKDGETRGTFTIGEGGKIIPPAVENASEQIESILLGIPKTGTAQQEGGDPEELFIDMNKDGVLSKGDIEYRTQGVKGIVREDGSVLATGEKVDNKNVGNLENRDGREYYNVQSNGMFSTFDKFITNNKVKLGVNALSDFDGKGAIVGPDKNGIIKFEKGAKGKGSLTEQWIRAVNSPESKGKKKIDVTSFMEALKVTVTPQKAPVIEKAPAQKEGPEAYGRFYTSGNVEHFDIDDSAIVSYKDYKNGTKEYKGTDLGITAENVNANINVGEDDKKSEFTKLKSSDGSTILVGEGAKEDLAKLKDGQTIDEMKAILDGKKIEAWAIKQGTNTPEKPAKDGNAEKSVEAPKQKTVAIEEIGDKNAHTMTIVTSPERGKDKLHPIGLKQMGDEYVSMFQDGNEKNELRITKAEIDALNKEPTNLPPTLAEKLNKEPKVILGNQPLYLQIPGVGTKGVDLGISLARKGDKIEVKAESQDNPLTKIPGIKSVTPDGKISFHPTDKRPEITLQAGKDGSLKLEKGEINVLEGKQTPREFFSQTPKRIQNLLLEKYTKSIKKPEAAPAVKATATEEQQA